MRQQAAPARAERANDIGFSVSFSPAYIFANFCSDSVRETKAFQRTGDLDAEWRWLNGMTKHYMNLKWRP